MKILAIDTATEACSAALYVDGETHQQYQLAPREHTRLILAMVQGLLETSGVSISQLDALAYGRGPGSFTGVRIANSIVQGMAFAAEIPVAPVSTLASIAQYIYDTQAQTRVLAVIDARMDEVYWGAYIAQHGIMMLQGNEGLCRPADIPVIDTEGWVGAGSGWNTYSEVLHSRLGHALVASDGDVFPHASSIAVLAANRPDIWVSAADALPVYLRDQIAKKKVAQ